MMGEQMAATPAQTRLIRAAALLDLLVTWPLVLPFTAAAYLELAYGLNRQFLGGFSATPAFDALTLLFFNLTGALAVLWALVRLARPQVFLGAADGIARLWVAMLIADYIIIGGLPPVFYAFVGTELLGSALQLPVLYAALLSSRGSRS